MHLMMHQFVFSLSSACCCASHQYVRRTFDGVRRTMTRNNYENTNAKRTEAGLNREKRTEAELTETMGDKRTEGEVELNHDGRRQHCSFSFICLYWYVVLSWEMNKSYLLRNNHYITIVILEDSA